MPATVYKGDLSEVTFGHETGIVLTHGHFTSGLTATRSTTGDITTITLATADAIAFSGAGVLRYPEGMLTGCKLRIIGGGNWATSDGDSEFTIVDNAGATIKVTPAMAATTALSDSDSIVINSFGCPTMDTGMAYATSAKASDETVLTDQFIGLAATVTLPETKVELKRAHIVGIGRDVVVQEPQKLSNEGGTIEMMLNSPRWLYYALGNECTIPSTTWTIAEALSSSVLLAVSAGETYIECSGALDSVPVAGQYIHLVDNSDVNLPTDHTDPANGVKFTGTQTNFQTAQRDEVRRVIMVDQTKTGARRIYVDDPFNFNHAAGLELRKMTIVDTDTSGSPHFDTATATYGRLLNYQQRAIWSGYHVPSFTLETSMRTRDVDSYGTGGYTGSSLVPVPGTASDAKQLTRVFKGCKVKEFTLTADADAEVKLSVGFDSLMCYTDVGRLEDDDAGDRFTAHRVFENIANGPAERKVAGIAPNTEKPYFFYNGQIQAFGITIGNVTSFNITGRNNIATHYTVRGSSFAEDRNTAGKSLEQIPFGGMRNPALFVEGKMEYEMKMAVIVDDPLLWHEFRTNRTKDFNNPITLTLNKAGAGATRESMTVIIDDYIITEAPLPIPEDKGVIKSEMTIMPKHVKVISRDLLLHC